MLRKIFLMLCYSALISAGVIRTDYSPASSVSYSSISTPVLKTISPSDEKTFSTPTGYTKIIQTPPVYRSVLTTKESNYGSPDSSQHTAYTKSLDTSYSSLKKYESKSTKNDDVSANTIPGIYSTGSHSPLIYHQGTAYSLSSPLTHTLVHTPVLKTVSVPVSYATHDVSLTKSVVPSSFASYSTPVLSKSVSTPVSYTTHSVPLTKTVISPTVVSHSTPVFTQTKYVTSGLSSYSSHTPVVESQPIKTTITYSQAPLVSHMSFSGLGANYAW